MSKVLFSTIITLAAAVALPGMAHAARAYSINILWMNSAGKVIGEQVGYCGSTLQSKAGTLNGPYSLEIDRGCGDNIIGCTTSKCSVKGHYYNTVIRNHTNIEADTDACLEYFGDTCGRVDAERWFASDDAGIPFPGTN